MAKVSVKLFAGSALFLLGGAVALGSGISWAEEGYQGRLFDVDIEKLPRTAEESTSLLDFFKERTRFGYGVDAVYTNNFFLKDNNKQEEYIITPEVEVFFNDPRGSSIYGIDYEVNAHRYYFQRVAAIDQDLHAFLDVDPGGRYKFGLTYDFGVSNSFVFGRQPGVDVIQRSTTLRQNINHDVGGSFRYALNETNSLVLGGSYSLDKNVQPKDLLSDREILSLSADVDHDLLPEWVLFGGYAYAKTTIPSDKRKDSDANGIRIGLRHELSEISKLETALTVSQTTFGSGQKSTNPDFDGLWEYEVGPRTKLKFKYKDTHTASFLSDRLQFRSINPSCEVIYELTPLIQLTGKGSFERQLVKGADLLAEVTQGQKSSSRFGLGSILDWQVREKIHFKVNYQYVRAKTADYTTQTVIVQIHAEF